MAFEDRVVRVQVSSFLLLAFFFSRIKRQLVHGFDLVGVEFGADEQPLQVVEDGDELRFGDGAALVVGAPPARDVGHAHRNLVPGPSHNYITRRQQCPRPFKGFRADR